MFRYLFNKLKIITYDNYYVHGDESNLILLDKKSCGLSNTLFNTSSGKITIGRNVIFGHNCMVLTGYHDYKKNIHFVPCKGFDINIGSNCWICSGAIIVGGVSIPDDSLVKAGEVIYRKLKVDGNGR